MGREIKRVPLDFDWPVGTIWPGFMKSICTEEVEYCVGKGSTDEEVCEACRHAGRLAGLELSGNCPEWGVGPPKGEGWQLWETVSEGSPISPVFATADELVDFMCQPSTKEGGLPWANGYDRESAEKWVKEIGWAPSFVGTPGRGLVDGVTALGREDVEKAKKGGA